VDRQRILDLPLDGRNPLELTALQAGVQLRTNTDGEIDRFSIKGTPSYLIGGWQAGGIARYNSGDPLSLLSGRGTFNRDDRSALNSINVAGNLSRDQSANFGRITSIVGRPRLMQFALRLNF